MAEAEPVIHLAAQALVRPTYDTVETFATNARGTLHVLEAARPLRSVQVIGNGAAFGEGDRLGGDDPVTARPAPSS
ncbi:nucleoside-diphosphate-sugar epimerase [Bradyrhizobium sp. i1.15.2]|uniref:NAD-dependent epimerase/dehydratase family protein n=1 Tax=Bradyrhizobium sp. i1.15.2 TaxID=3156362 RepID=UPI003399FBEF